VGIFLTGAFLPVLCLGQVILTQEGALPRPSISAEPGSVILWGQPVTIVCRGPAEAETFRLLWVDDSNYTDQKILPQHPPHETEARFPITRMLPRRGEVVLTATGLSPHPLCLPVSVTGV
uniref:Ig-like domain-containing protein n=1 Tax=Equus asinus asinus TaxID=83772 RepID=A0A8C4PUS1_EQUAS